MRDYLPEVVYPKQRTPHLSPLPFSKGRSERGAYAKDNSAFKGQDNTDKFARLV